MTSALLNVEIGVLAPKQILFSGSGYAPGANRVIEVGTLATDVVFTMSGVVDTEARMSAKADLGPLWAVEYALKVAVEFFGAPTASALVHFFWSPSESSTAAVGNDGGVSGSDADYTGYSTDLVDAVRQLMFIGSLSVTTAVAVQIATVGMLRPPSRYGMIVAFNESGATLAATDGVETACALNPVVMQGQDT